MSTIDISARNGITRFNEDHRPASRAGRPSSFNEAARIRESGATPDYDGINSRGSTGSPSLVPSILKVRDVMSKDVISVAPSSSVHEIAEAMYRNGIGSIPVIDSVGRLRGVVSERDLIQRAEIGTEPRRSWWQVAFRDAISASHDYVRSHGRKARDVMTRDPLTTTAEQPLHEVASKMARRGLKNMPVISGKRVIGIVSGSDIIRALIKRSAMETKESTDRDDVVRERILDRIRSLPWSMSMFVANVTVSDGVARIYGWVASNIERRALHVVVENTSGVRDVEDCLHRTPPYV